MQRVEGVDGRVCGGDRRGGGLCDGGGGGSIRVGLPERPRERVELELDVQRTQRGHIGWFDDERREIEIDPEIVLRGDQRLGELRALDARGDRLLRARRCELIDMREDGVE